uniref:DUF1985 domain-containing protein n=1 Tax=Cannabis sativa TaxID=3483 RepID=A0A803NHS8_CANSA
MHMAPKLKLSLSDHFTSRLTYRGSNRFKDIKTTFEKYKLTEQVKVSPFKPFLEGRELNFSSALVHNVLLRKMKFNKEKEDEIWLYVGKTDLRFGRTEVGLITCLNMGTPPTYEKIQAKSSDCLLRMYFEGKGSVHLDTLMLQMEIWEDKDDVYKLKLCVFIKGVLVLKDGNIIVWPDMLKFVDDLEFFKYQWREHTFCKLMSSINKDMMHYKQTVKK